MYLAGRRTRKATVKPWSRTGKLFYGPKETEDALANIRRKVYHCPFMDEGRKRVLGIMAAILASLHMQTADDLFGGPQGSPRSDKLIAASVQWAEKIMEKIDNVFRSSDLP
jgi:hypothetical protein